ncbi:MAG: acyl carrier protein [Acidobacteria bacterium]|nr:MAG: acyl carrier protein [Acidobacteriota bacterium]
MNETEARLVKCFSALFPELGAHEIAQAHSASVPSWDSVASITLMIAIEEEFRVSINPEDFAKFESFQQILSYLEGVEGEARCSSHGDRP